MAVWLIRYRTRSIGRLAVLLRRLLLVGVGRLLLLAWVGRLLRVGMKITLARIGRLAAIVRLSILLWRNAVALLLWRLLPIGVKIGIIPALIGELMQLNLLCGIKIGIIPALVGELMPHIHGRHVHRRGHGPWNGIPVALGWALVHECWTPAPRSPLHLHVHTCTLHTTAMELLAWIANEAHLGDLLLLLLLRL